VIGHVVLKLVRDHMMRHVIGSQGHVLGHVTWKVLEDHVIGHVIGHMISS